MKNIINYKLSIFYFFLTIFVLNVFAQKSEKAIIDSSKENGIRLSLEAKKNIGVKTFILNSSGSHQIPKASLVYTKDKTGVYRFKNDWYKFIEVKVLVQNTNSFQIFSSELLNKDEIVSEGAGLLRVSEMEAFAGVE